MMLAVDGAWKKRFTRLSPETAVKAVVVPPGELQ
jgi:hypothetical protein